MKAIQILSSVVCDSSNQFPIDARINCVYILVNIHNSNNNFGETVCIIFNVHY